MDIWYDVDENNEYLERILRMIQTAKRLFVWISGKPCVMVLPPHCFHTVLTLSTACHSGVRAGCDLWNEEMALAIQYICARRETKYLRRRRNYEHLHRKTLQIIPDIEVWIGWCETIRRDPTEKEAALIDDLDRLIQVIRMHLRLFPRKQK